MSWQEYKPKTELAKLLLSVVKEFWELPGHEGVAYGIDLNEALKQADEGVHISTRDCEPMDGAAQQAILDAAAKIKAAYTEDDANDPCNKCGHRRCDHDHAHGVCRHLSCPCSQFSKKGGG